MQVADSSRLLVPFGCVSSPTAPPAAPELPHGALGCFSAISSSLFICNKHTSWATTFSRASQDKLPKVPDLGATSWFKVISWWQQLESRFPMFSSGLFGSCCSQDWDSASFCTPASLKGTHMLHMQTCHCSPKLQLVRGGMLEGVKTQPALGQTREAGTALALEPIALKGVPCYSLSSERDSLLLAEMQVVLLPAQGRHSSPSLTSPAAPWTRGVSGLGWREQGECVGLWGLGFSQLFASHVPSHVPSVCPVPVQAPQPQTISPVLTLGRPCLWSGIEDAPYPILRWYPDYLLSSKTPPQLGQSQAGLWVQSACLAFPVSSPLVRW